VAAQREKLRAALEELYATSSNLASYVEQNRTGFRKILKKHDKLVSVSAVSIRGSSGGIAVIAAGFSESCKDQQGLYQPTAVRCLTCRPCVAYFRGGTSGGAYAVQMQLSGLVFGLRKSAAGSSICCGVHTHSCLQ
jgi:hypothetical protein